MDVQDARALHRELPVVDLHADTPKLMHWFGFNLTGPHDRPLPSYLNYAGHVDVPRMKEAGMAAQVFGLWTLPYPRRGCAASVHAQLDVLDSAVADSHDLRWWQDGHQIGTGSSIAVLAGIEGGQALQGDLDRIVEFAARGVCYIGLVHFSANEIATPAMGWGANAHDGLSRFGRDAIREMNRAGVVVDLAHINRRGFFDALEVSRAPVMVSHTGVTGVHDHWRNIDDEQLRAVARGGGCVGIIFAKRFLGGADIEAVCDHILHVIDVAGEDVPALGSDFDGMVRPANRLEDVSQLPNLTAALARRGLQRSTLAKILGGNALRVLAAASQAGAAGRQIATTQTMTP